MIPVQPAASRKKVMAIILNSVVERERYAQDIITDCFTKSAGILDAV